MTAIALLLLCAAAIVYWRIRANRTRALLRAFEPLPQSPADHDLYHMAQQLRDSQVEREWREAVAANVARRAEQKPPCMFHVKQAG